MVYCNTEDENSFEPRASRSTHPHCLCGCREAEQSYYGTLDTLCGAFKESTLAFGLALSTDAVVDVLGGLKSMCGTEQQLQELREGLPLLLSDDDAEVEKGRAVVDELFDEYDSRFL